MKLYDQKGFDYVRNSQSGPGEMALGEVVRLERLLKKSISSTKKAEAEVQRLRKQDDEIYRALRDATDLRTAVDFVMRTLRCEPPSILS